MSHKVELQKKTYITNHASRRFGRYSILYMVAPFNTKLHASQNAPALGVMWSGKVEVSSRVFGKKRVQCCFCGEGILGSFPIEVRLKLEDGAFQSFLAHGLCIKERLHPSVPFLAPEEPNDN